MPCTACPNRWNLWERQANATNLNQARARQGIARSSRLSEEPRVSEHLDTRCMAPRKWHREKAASPTGFETDRLDTRFERFRTVRNSSTLLHPFQTDPGIQFRGSKVGICQRKRPHRQGVGSRGVPRARPAGLGGGDSTVDPLLTATSPTTRVFFRGTPLRDPARDHRPNFLSGVWFAVCPLQPDAQPHFRRPKTHLPRKDCRTQTTTVGISRSPLSGYPKAQTWDGSPEHDFDPLTCSVGQFQMLVFGSL